MVNQASSLMIIETLLSKSGSLPLLPSGQSSTTSNGGGLLSSLVSQLDWQTMRNLIFFLAFALVSLYQYCKWKRNKQVSQAA
jgi:hypothetical protein